MQKETKRYIDNKKILKIIPVIYFAIFTIVLSLLMFFSGINYYMKRHFILPNILSLILIVGIFILFYKRVSNNDISTKKYRNVLITLFILTAIIQIIIIINTYFYTAWDVKVIKNIIEKYLEKGNLKGNYYLTIYPNNILITGILAFLRKLPLIGKYYITTLFFNAFIVNIAGLFTSLTIKNMHSKKAGIICYFILAPLILFSPWINIPYTDTFALLFTATLFYFYTRPRKKKKDYFFIGFLSLLGYYIKPTVIIILIAIIMVEFTSNINNYSKYFFKKKYIIVFVFFIGIFSAIVIKKATISYLKFEPSKSKNPIFITHFLAMGQNDNTLGAYSEEDIEDTLILGEFNNITKFKSRLLNRTFYGQIKFFSKKTLLNFNDGSFGWGLEDSFFYKKTKTKSKIARFLREIYYEDGKYYDYFIQIQNYLWLILLFFMPFLVKKKNSKYEYVLMLSIIGLIMFLTIFEPRTRYMYCYSGIFTIASILGIYNLKDKVMKK